VQSRFLIKPTTSFSVKTSSFWQTGHAFRLGDMSGGGMVFSISPLCSISPTTYKVASPSSEMELAKEGKGDQEML
jgi:hypothetical protein